MSKQNDPANKYLPKPRQSQAENGEAEVKHGLFTDIAYVTAWAVGILGSLAAVALIVSAAQGGYDAEYEIFMGFVMLGGSWVSASCLGVLAEISRKLSMRGA
ncbi:MAG: hypothetical protein EP336_14305 [Rhodobacteraceae bacterium]|nr:MAG: hypothetical protein EP336_14305 [Paracoccaceae bacterium]